LLGSETHKGINEHLYDRDTWVSVGWNMLNFTPGKKSVLNSSIFQMKEGVNPKGSLV
jgi:hypothetical protein